MVSVYIEDMKYVEVKIFFEIIFKNKNLVSKLRMIFIFFVVLKRIILEKKK